MSTIKNSWTLMAFARQFGKAQLGGFTNHKSGETFKSMVFTNEEGTNTFVSFSSKLGELTASQIVEQKHNLQIIQLESGKYKLCKVGENSWETIDL